MLALSVLLPLSFLFVLLIGAALWWAIFSGQFDDVQRHGASILEDDDSIKPVADDASDSNHRLSNANRKPVIEDGKQGGTRNKPDNA